MDEKFKRRTFSRNQIQNQVLSSQKTNGSSNLKKGFDESQHKNSEKADNPENLRFKCAFSKDAIRHNTIMMLSALVPTIIILSYLFIMYQKWIGFVFVIFIIAILIYNQLFIKKLSNESYIEITPDGTLKCKYYSRTEIDYPINEIKSIEEATLKEAYKKHATFSVVFHSKGRDIYHESGVLITFNRSWIKSVSPVYFNPADSAGFISAINKMRESKTLF